MPNINFNRGFVSQVGHSEINWGHPLAKGLVFHSNFSQDGRHRHDSVFRNRPSFNGNCSFVGTPYGLALFANAGDLRYQSRSEYNITGDISFEVKILPTDIVGWHNALTKEATNINGSISPDTTRSYGIQLRDTSVWRGQLIKNDGTNMTVDSVTAASLSRTDHIFVTRSGSNLYIFVNGVLEGVNTSADGILNVGNGSLFIANTESDSADRLTGYYLIASVWNRYFTNSEIRWRYEQPYDFLVKPRKIFLFSISEAVNIIESTPTKVSVKVVVNTPTVTSVHHADITATKVSVSAVVKSATASVQKHIEITATKVSVSARVNSPTVAVTKHVDITPTTVLVSVTVKQPTASIAKHVSITVTKLSYTVRVGTPTVSVSKHIDITASKVSIKVRVGTVTVTVESAGLPSDIDDRIYCKSRIEKFIGFECQIQKSYAKKSPIEKTLTYNSLMEKMVVVNSPIEKRIVAESEIIP